jgi:hypothetical protein
MIFALSELQADKIATIVKAANINVSVLLVWSLHQAPE